MTASLLIMLFCLKNKTLRSIIIIIIIITIIAIVFIEVWRALVQLVL